MRNNYFDLIRLLLAFLVAFEHAFLVFEGNAASPFGFMHMSLNYFAVNGFFVISGFLVTKSMAERQNLFTFARSRFLRIYPALIVLVLVCIFVIGPIMTSLARGTYFADPGTWNFASQILTFRDAEPPLPGVRFDTGLPESLSVVLWTLRYEMLAYFGTAVLFATGLLKRTLVVAVLTVLTMTAYGAILVLGLQDVVPDFLEILLRFSSLYLLGSLLALSPGWRRSAWSWSFAFGMIGLLLIYLEAPLAELALNGALGFGLLWAAFLPALGPLKEYQSLEDISYGLYIWHWPIYQIVGHFFPEFGTAGIMAIGLPVSFLVAILSWFLVEKPALRLKALRPRYERAI